MTDLAYKVWSSRVQGGTFSVYREHTPTDGYMVGGESWSMVMDVNRLTVEHVRLYIMSHARLLHSEDLYLGIWTDASDQRAYVDISSHILSFDRAKALAHYRGELAIWDNTRNEEINVQYRV